MSNWLMVSNRLPFTFDLQSKKMRPSSGGLVTAIRGIKTKQQQMTWVGSVTDDLPDELMNEVRKRQDQGMDYLPVTVASELYESYYNGFCNDVLWPLFHYETEY